MDSVTVSELNRQTAKVLDRVKAGESLEISEYGRPVARLSPAVPTTGAPLLDRLIAQGKAHPANPGASCVRGVGLAQRHPGRDA